MDLETANEKSNAICQATAAEVVSFSVETASLKADVLAEAKECATLNTQMYEMALGHATEIQQLVMSNEECARRHDAEMRQCVTMYDADMRELRAAMSKEQDGLREKLENAKYVIEELRLELENARSALEMVTEESDRRAMERVAEELKIATEKADELQVKVYGIESMLEFRFGSDFDFEFDVGLGIGLA